MDELSGGAVRSSVEAGLSGLTFAADADAASELFVINLCASMTPMTISKGLPGFEQYKLYQVSRIEDGRRRFRLRLGFFRDEAAADIVLNAVRHNYPTAFTACLSEEDMRHAPEGHRTRKVKSAPAGLTAAAKSTATPPSVTIPPVASKKAAAPAQKAAPIPAASTSVATKPATVAAAPKPAPATQPVPTKAHPIAAKRAPEQSVITVANDPPPSVQQTRDVPHDPRKPSATHSAAAITQASAQAAGIEFAQDAPQARPQPAPESVKASKPFHVAAGIQLPDVNFELAGETAPIAPATAASQANIKAPTPSRATVDKANRPSLLDKPPTPVEKALALPPVTVRGDMIPVLDSTQTIRTLSAAELNDENQPKWYAVQLAISEQPMNLEAMPRLDIFAAYALYSVAVMEEGTIRHALRLGFFKEEVSADAVSGYLKTFFPTPKIIRISAAEHKRFSDPPPRKREPTPDNVVQLDQARGDRTHKPVAPAATPPAPAAKTPSAAPKKAAARESAPPAKHAAMPAKKTPSNMKTGAHRTLGEQLKEEARQVVLSQSGVHKQPRQGSLLSRLVDKLKQ